MEEFKIGDKVKILEEYSGYSSELIATVGKIGKITKTLECSVLVYFEDIKASFFYFNKNLELVNDEDTSPKYTYADVILDPNDPRVEIGAEYWFSDCPNPLVKRLNDAKEAKHGHLSLVESNNDLPFYDEDSRCWLCIIRKKGPTYEERQDEWVKANDIKAGDKVRILKGFVGETKDIPYGFTYEMEKLIGKTLEVKGVGKKYIKVFDENKHFHWAWPYYCLEKVEEPEFKVGDFVRTEYESIGVITEIIAHDFVVVRTNNLSYFNLSKSRLEHIKAHLKPFDLEDKDTRDKIRGCWIRKKDNSEIKLIWGLWELDGKWMIDEGTNPQELLNDWVFEDGSPCGIVVEDEQ